MDYKDRLLVVLDGAGQIAPLLMLVAAVEIFAGLLPDLDLLVGEITNRCTEVESGARNIDNILTNTLLPDLSRVLLEAMVEGNPPERVHVTLDDGGQFAYVRDDEAPASGAAPASEEAVATPPTP